MTTYNSIPSTRRSFRTLQLVLINALLFVPLLSNATPVKPTANGFNADWAAVENINGINVHRGDGSYVQSLPAHATNWTATSSGDYFFVSVVGDDWQQWQRSVVVTLSEDAVAIEPPRLGVENGQLSWDSLAGNSAIRSINVHHENGGYVTTLGANATTYVPAEFGSYFIVAVIGDDWQNWVRSNTVIYGDVPINAILTASSYQDILAATLEFFRADYFQPYMQVVFDTMRLWQPDLPSVTNTFDTMATWDEFSSEDDDRSCDSGTVDRVVTDISTPGLGSVPRLSATYVYNDCVFGGRTINGSIMISMQGDSPARLGGQAHREWIEWISVTISQDPESTTLSGRYTHSDGYGGPYRSFTEEFSTEQFTLSEQFDGEPDYTVTVTDSHYEVAFRSSYFSEDAAISLTENGQLTIANENISAEMTMTDFSYDGDVQNSDGAIRLSIGENIADGSASLVFSDGSSLQISKDNATDDTVQYAISEGTETTYVLDTWLQPVRCEVVALGVFSDYSACP